MKKHIFHGLPFVFEGREAEYFEFRQLVGNKFRINFHEVFIVGSAKLGFSYIKQSHFSYDSDIDVVLVNEELFEYYYKQICDYQYQLDKFKKIPTERELVMYNRFLQYLVKGWMNILPRSSIIKRQAVGQFGEVQIIATNIDYAFLVQATDRDFNINRLERYLTICYSAKVKPVIVLTKTDLTDDLRINEILNSIKTRIKNVPVIPVSNETKNGYEAINAFIEQGKTYCMLGSSGVGKSTLLNNLSGESLMRTDIISQSTNKGKHVTSHRELIILENGEILIDNPGMREVGIADSAGGLETTFDMIVRLSKNCKFKDCTHTTEIGCSVIEAVEKGEIDKASYENYLKMEREKIHFELTIAEKRKKDKKFGKMVSNYKKDREKN